MNDLSLVLLCLLAAFLVVVVGAVVGALIARWWMRRLDGIGAVPPVSPQSPLPPLATEGVSEKAIASRPPFTVETVQRVADGLRDRYAAHGGYMPTEAELREQAINALHGHDIL